MPSKNFPLILLLVVLATGSLYMNAFLARTWKVAQNARGRNTSSYASSISGADRNYTYIGDDHPALLPVRRDPVLMVVEESVHYPVTGATAFEEWIWTGPDGDHDIRLGEMRRSFAIPMFHQLHCLRGIRLALERRNFTGLHPVQQGHLHHCFNYLRQWALCSADVTLEPGDFAQRNFTVERTGAVHKCWDWKPVYDVVNLAWDDWEMYRIAHGVPSPLV